LCVSMTTLYVHPADETNSGSAYADIEDRDYGSSSSGQNPQRYRDKRRSFRNKHCSPRHQKYYGNKSMNNQFQNQAHAHASQWQSSRGQRQHQQKSPWNSNRTLIQSSPVSGHQFSTPRSVHKTGGTEYADATSSDACTPKSVLARTPISAISTPPMHAPLSVMSTPSSYTSTVAPPSLYFQISDDAALRATNNQSSETFGFSNVAALSGPPPPLSELTSSDGALLLNVDDFSELEKLSIQEIQGKLNAQRFQNEQLLAKLHCDQKKFQKIWKHYEKKNELLQRQITMLEAENPAGNECAQRMNTLFNEHQTELDLNQQEHIQYEQSKSMLWNGISTNMQLLADVNSLTKSIDNYHLLISKKRKQAAIRNGEYIKSSIKNIQDDQKDEEKEVKTLVLATNTCQETSTANVGGSGNSKQAVSVCDQVDSKMMEEPVGVTVDVKQEKHVAYSGLDTVHAEENPVEQYANQLLETNKRYQEIVGLLRKKMDELRAYWKKL